MVEDRDQIEGLAACLTPFLAVHGRWTSVPVRCAQAGVPDAAVAPRSKGEIALAELDRLRAENLRLV